MSLQFAGKEGVGEDGGREIMDIVINRFTLGSVLASDVVWCGHM